MAQADSQGSGGSLKEQEGIISWGSNLLTWDNMSKSTSNIVSEATSSRARTSSATEANPTQSLDGKQKLKLKEEAIDETIDDLLAEEDTGAPNQMETDVGLDQIPDLTNLCLLVSVALSDPSLKPYDIGY